MHQTLSRQTLRQLDTLKCDFPLERINSSENKKNFRVVWREMMRERDWSQLHFLECRSNRVTTRINDHVNLCIVYHSLTHPIASQVLACDKRNPPEWPNCILFVPTCLCRSSDMHFNRIIIIVIACLVRSAAANATELLAQNRRPVSIGAFSDRLIANGHGHCLLPKKYDFVADKKLFWQRVFRRSNGFCLYA